MADVVQAILDVVEAVHPGTRTYHGRRTPTENPRGNAPHAFAVLTTNRRLSATAFDRTVADEQAAPGKHPRRRTVQREGTVRVDLYAADAQDRAETLELAFGRDSIKAMLDKVGVAVVGAPSILDLSGIHREGRAQLDVTVRWTATDEEAVGVIETVNTTVTGA